MFTLEEKERIERAARLRRLKEQPGYKDLLDEIERLSDGKLARLRASISSDALVTHEFARNWKIYEQVLQDIQVFVEKGIEDGESIVRDELRKSGLPTETVTELIVNNVLTTEVM